MAGDISPPRLKFDRFLKHQKRMTRSTSGDVFLWMEQEKHKQEYGFRKGLQRDDSEANIVTENTNPSAKVVILDNIPVQQLVGGVAKRRLDVHQSFPWRKRETTTMLLNLPRRISHECNCWHDTTPQQYTQRKPIKKAGKHRRHLPHSKKSERRREKWALAWQQQHQRRGRQEPEETLLRFGVAARKGTSFSNKNTKRTETTNRTNVAGYKRIYGPVKWINERKAGKKDGGELGRRLAWTVGRSKE